MRRQSKPDWARRPAVTRCEVPPDLASVDVIRDLTAGECSRVDDLPPVIRRAYKSCAFEVNPVSAFRFAKHVERSGMSDDDVRRVFGAITTPSDVIKFNKIWNAS